MIVTLAIIVIPVGSMRKLKCWILFLACGILILYLAYLLFSKKEFDQRMGLFLAAATLIVAFISLLYQRRSLIMQIRLSVFSDSIHLLLNDDKFSESQDYIFSRSFDEDISFVRQILQDNHHVDLDDFRRALHQIRKDGNVINIDLEDRERLRVSYNKLKYFLSRMEYLGVLAVERGVETLLLEYYGYTIINTYERLSPIIKKPGGESYADELYSHYTNLYTLARTNRKKSCFDRMFKEQLTF